MENNIKNNIIKNKKVAIIFFGLTRSLNKTIDSIKKHLFEILSMNSIDYDIFIHHYKIFGSYENIWSKEKTLNYVNEDIQSLLNPKYELFDVQQDTIDIINFDEYYKKLGNWTGMSTTLTKLLIRNMCLALYSKKKITSLFESYKDDYDYAIIMRPDLSLKSDINIEWFNELNEQNIIIPSCDGFRGCNDRFCIGTPNIVTYYGSLFDELKEYSRKKSIISERYLMDMLNKKNIMIIKKNILYDTIRI
jgi:hypothetical protein